MVGEVRLKGHVGWRVRREKGEGRRESPLNAFIMWLQVTPWLIASGLSNLYPSCATRLSRFTHDFTISYNSSSISFIPYHIATPFNP